MRRFCLHRTIRVWLKRDSGQYWPSVYHTMPCKFPLSVLMSALLLIPFSPSDSFSKNNRNNPLSQVATDGHKESLFLFYFKVCRFHVLTEIRVPAGVFNVLPLCVAAPHICDSLPSFSSSCAAEGNPTYQSARSAANNGRGCKCEAFSFTGTGIHVSHANRGRLHC